MCDENKEKNDCLSEIFLTTAMSSSECYTTVDQPMNNNETTWNQGTTCGITNV